ncbi:MAG: rod shape-determining protein [Desulfovibrionaceae bacterium]
MFNAIFDCFTRHRKLGMDLGTANTLVCAPGLGIVLNEPSVVALEAATGKVLAVGHEAKSYLGRAPGRIHLVQPIRDGVIADFDVTRLMIDRFLEQVRRSLGGRAGAIVVSVPLGVTPVEKRAVVDACEQSGIRTVRLVSEPVAAAVGAGLPVTEPVGNMILDIGGGTSEVAVITLGSVALSESVRVAGDSMDQAILRHVQRVFKMSIGVNTAEQVKIRIGSAMPSERPRNMPVSGLHLVKGSPSTVTVSEDDVREAIRECLATIVESLRNALERIPPELSGDIYDRGLLVTGGGALLTGLRQRLEEDLRVKVRMDADPLTAVARGTARVLNEMSRFEDVFID